MVANELKTTYVVFGNLNTFSLKLNGKNLEMSSYEYQGNIINSTRVLWYIQRNTDYLCYKTRQSVFSMINKIKNLDIPAPTVLHLYQTLLQSVLVHGSDVWSVAKRGPSEADKVFNWFLPLILRFKLNKVQLWWWGKWVCFHQVYSATRMCLCISRDWIICLLDQF